MSRNEKRKLIKQCEGVDKTGMKINGSGMRKKSESQKLL